MNMLVQFGVGLIFHAIQDHQAQAQAQQLSQQNTEWAEGLRKQMGQATDMADANGMDPFANADAFANPDMEGTAAFNQPGVGMQQAPEFPQQAADNLQDMQMQHAQQLQTLSDQFLQTSTALKSNFLNDNHLATTTPTATAQEPNPEPQVALDDNHQPVVQKGPENAVQQQARETFEDQSQNTLSAQHSDQTQQFVQDQKQNVQQFLADNKPDLSNPAIQQQLHNMLGGMQKKAWQLQTDQEREMLKHDAYTPEMQTNVDNYVNQKSTLVQQQNQEQEDSPDAQVLYQHQQDLGAMLQQKRDQLQESQQESSFLTGPPRFNSAPDEGPADVAKVLPPYLSDALYGMGIYQV
jgi:hypothetical protein